MPADEPGARRAPQVYRAPREWTRLHPVSPLLGGWAVFAVVGSIILNNALGDWGDDGQDLAATASGLLAVFPLVLGGVGLIIGIAIGTGYLQWRVNHYRLSDDAVEQRKGLLFKQHKQARLDRVQAVDVVQPLLARIFGFAALKIEVAGGANSAVELQYLRLGDAEAIRNELLALAAGIKRAKAEGREASVDAILAGANGGTRAGSGAEASAHESAVAASASAHGDEPNDAAAGQAQPAAASGGSLRDVADGFLDLVDNGRHVFDVETAAAPEREVFVVPTKRLLQSIALSWSFLVACTIPLWLGIPLLLIEVDWNQVLAAGGTSLVGLIPAVIAVVGIFWGRLSGGFGFRAAISHDGIRLRHGLLETRRQTVPPGRVQAVKLQQSLLWRRKDWWRVTINVAGYQDDQDEVSTLLPVGTRQDALTALWMVLPDLGDPDPAGTVSLALSGTGDQGDFTASSRRARLFDPWQWRNRGVRATDRALLIRRGRLVRDVFVVPHERTQSLALSQGPLQRHRGVATFTVHSTNGPVRPVAAHLDVEDAEALLVAQAARAAEGRRRQTPEQWMATMGVDGSGQTDTHGAQE